jgi:hypothetical protein
MSGLRGLLVAIVVIVLSSSAAAAAGPSGHAANGPATAAEKAGKTVPVAAQEESEQDEGTEPETEDETEAAPEDAGGDHCATDPRTLEPEALAQLNHGAIVCWAAHQQTPEGFDNHGAWVSSWAKQNKGHANEESAAASTNRGQSKDKTGHGSSND